MGGEWTCLWAMAQFVEVTGQSRRMCSLLSSCRSRSNSGYKTWLQAPYPLSHLTGIMAQHTRNFQNLRDGTGNWEVKSSLDDETQSQKKKKLGYWDCSEVKVPAARPNDLSSMLRLISPSCPLTAGVLCHTSTPPTHKQANKQNFNFWKSIQALSIYVWLQNLCLIIYKSGLIYMCLITESSMVFF